MDISNNALKDRLVDRDEHVANVLRLRKAALIALVTWPLFVLVDWFIVAYVHPGRLWVYLSLRAVGMFVLLIAIALINGRKLPSRHRVLVLDALTCWSMAVLITISCIEFGGITSPLVLGVITVMLCRSAVFSQNWKRSSIPVGLTAAAYPLTFAVLFVYSPLVKAQFDDGQAVAGFILNLLFVIGSAMITIVGGHIVWSLRRQVFEARSFGRYQLKHQIGAGGMGQVWSAHHSALRRDVAVKILRAEQNTNPLSVARFEREVRATVELNHPNTIRVFDYGTTEDGLWYYAMELLEGHDLKALVKTHGPIEPARAVKLIWQASKALAEAHERGIIHRDMKPENLFVTRVGDDHDFIKVLDFGLAKLAQQGEEGEGLTKAGFAVGTPKYVSPEVVFGKDADARSDVYGLGAVLYYCLCGKPPFEFKGIRQNLLAHARQTPPLPSQKLGRLLPASVEAVVMRCLSKDPAHRYANGAKLAYALEQAAASFLVDNHLHTEQETLQTLYAETMIRHEPHNVRTRRHQQVAKSAPRPSELRPILGSYPDSAPTSRSSPKHHQRPVRVVAKPSSAASLAPAFLSPAEWETRAGNYHQYHQGDDPELETIVDRTGTDRYRASG